MILTCDGEKNYLLFSKTEYSEEEAIKEAQKRLSGNLIVEYADARDYGAVTKNVKGQWEEVRERTSNKC